MAQPPVVFNSLLAALIETLLYGAFLSMILPCVRFLLYRRQMRNKLATHQPIDTINIVVGFYFLFAVSVHWFLTTSLAVDSFIFAPEGTAAYFAKLQNPKNTARHVVMLTISLAQNTLLLFRAYAVWKFRPLRIHLMLMVPASLIVGFIVCGILFIVDLNGSTAKIIGALMWFPILHGLALSENLIAASLVSYRLLKSYPGFPQTAEDRRSSKFAALLLWQSTGLYCVFHAISFLTFFTVRDASTVYVHLLAPIIGIAFCMLNIRISGHSLGAMEAV